MANDDNINNDARLTGSHPSRIPTSRAWTGWSALGNSPGTRGGESPTSGWREASSSSSASISSRKVSVPRLAGDAFRPQTRKGDTVSATILHMSMLGQSQQVHELEESPLCEI